MPTDPIDWSDQIAATALARRLDTQDELRRERLRRPEALSNAARWYSAQGFPVFPLKPGSKQPATRHGLHDASTDPDVVAGWWARAPEANIGLPTGIAFDVLDVDPPGGWTSLAELRADGLVPDPPLGYAITPRRGAHIYVPPTGQGNRAGFLPGLDWRGLGGYVVAPPSRTEVGVWEWVPELCIGRTP